MTYFYSNEKIQNSAFKLLEKHGDEIVQGVSVKHNALLTYFIRLIRPVWELNIIAMSSKNIPLSNSGYFILAQEKI